MVGTACFPLASVRHGRPPDLETSPEAARQRRIRRVNRNRGIACINCRRRSRGNLPFALQCDKQAGGISSGRCAAWRPRPVSRSWRSGDRCPHPTTMASESAARGTTLGGHATNGRTRNSALKRTVQSETRKPALGGFLRSGSDVPDPCWLRLGFEPASYVLVIEAICLPCFHHHPAIYPSGSSRVDHVR